MPCVLSSPVPCVAQLARMPLITVEPMIERAVWPPIEVLDRRSDDPRSGLYASALAEMVRAARRAEPGRAVVFVLNRTGRVRLSACQACGELVRCEHCGAALAETVRAAPGEARVFSCASCGSTRPALCAACGSTRLRQLRVGVSRAAEELSALLGTEVGEVAGVQSELPRSSVLVGTEAVLHRVGRASLVVFLDFDQELLAPRYLASEHALVLVARAARLLGGAATVAFSRRIVIQTRVPDHPVLVAARAGDPGRLADEEATRRRELRLPPSAALAELVRRECV